MLGPHLESPADAIRPWGEPVSGRAGAPTAVADRVTALADQVTTLTASAVGHDGAIRVTVAGSGAVTALELDDRVQRLSGADLAAQIMATVQRAQSALVERVAEAVAQTVGADTETGRVVLASFARRFAAAPESLAAPVSVGHRPAGVFDLASQVPVMPAPRPFPEFPHRPSLPHQVPGVGFESGRDSRAR
ncbi:YbaB/EbfC DNA-binding family protein [Krasilnikovia cinnamomea]|uniref:YbaB/EbfC DNA-binding family protein n=1 Tax=Krasilnikovia cinnamomea TaxID=349313 RepID=A0A4V2G7E6_9ACTN|nr:YbaB/EbfC family nucleoid-associated protein [Krasilnikovia cinnamomea]RZU52256.1 YbaB/EbfC DNA-binding family protein [Krasilnikovia cinnamomea]